MPTPLFGIAGSTGLAAGRAVVGRETVVAPGKEVVVLFLPADGCGWSVTGEDGCFVGQAEELVSDAVQLSLWVASGQVGASDAAAEQRVAAEQECCIGDVEGR